MIANCNRVNDPGLCGYSWLTIYFCRPDIYTPCRPSSHLKKCVAQTSDLQMLIALTSVVPVK